VSAHPAFPARVSVANVTPPPAPSPLSLHDALPISCRRRRGDPRRPSSRGPGARGWPRVRGSDPPPPAPAPWPPRASGGPRAASRSEEHTSELQSLTNLVCRLLLEKKNNSTHQHRCC